jgi:hypothetical protein
MTAPDLMFVEVVAASCRMPQPGPDNLLAAPHFEDFATTAIKVPLECFSQNTKGASTTLHQNRRNSL